MLLLFDGVVTGSGGDYNSFISTWDTTLTSGGSSTDTQVALPLEAAGTYDFYVDWGDSNIDHITVWNQAEVTHTYLSTGIYTIKMTGVINGFRFGNNGDKSKILNISRWGTLQLGNNNGYFYGCNNLADITALDILNLSGVTDMILAFGLCGSLNEVSNINLWNTNTVTNMGYVFLGCVEFNQNISNWDISNVTDISSMFGGCSMFNQDVSGWDLSNVTTIASMFSGCSVFNYDLSLWNTGNISNMNSVFTNCLVLNQDFSSWDVTSVTSAEDMFHNCTLSNANYNSLLIGWAAQVVNNNVVFSGGDSHYDGAGVAARAVLTGTYSWIITDGGTP